MARELYVVPSISQSRPRLCNPLRGRAVKGRGRLKADKFPARVQCGDGRCAGSSANVCRHLAGAGVGSYQVFAKLHGLLGGVDDMGHGLE